MDKFENLQTSSENKQHYIPMEVTAETIKDFGINPADVVWTRIGNRKARVIMIPVSEEQYYEYMRPLWREDKRQQRQEPAVSLDKLYEETEYEVADTDSDIEADVMKKMLIDELHKALDELEEIDRTIMEMYSKNHSEAEIGQAIGMSQKGVNKRKHKVLLKLNTRLKDFKYFNSRTHVECDDWDWWVKSSPQHFNSRTHVECDFQSDVCYKLGIDFNSRTHVECDQYHQMKNVDMIFQLTHSRGVRLASVQDFKNHFSFQLTHSRGVRHNSLLASSVFRTISTHALTWSATFNTVEPKIYLFNKPSSWTYRNWLGSKARYLMKQIQGDILEWVRLRNMTGEEKTAHPEAETTGGYLKKLNNSESAPIWWRGLTDDEKNIILSIPNFDKEIFKEITGIDVDKED